MGKDPTISRRPAPVPRRRFRLRKPDGTLGPVVVVRDRDRGRAERVAVRYFERAFPWLRTRRRYHDDDGRRHSVPEARVVYDGIDFE